MFTYAGGLEINDLARKVGRCDEIAGLVVECKCALVRQELMLSLHAAESEDAGKLELPHDIAVLFT